MQKQSKKSKPWIHKCTIVSCIHDSKDGKKPRVLNHILDLTPVHVIEYADIFHVQMDTATDLYNKSDPLLNSAPTSVHIGYTQDPYVAWAGDWGHIGNFRLEIICTDVKEIIKTEQSTIIKCNSAVRRINMPNRVLDAPYEKYVGGGLSK